MTNYQITNLHRCENCSKETVIKFRVPDDELCVMDVSVHVCINYKLTTVDVVKEKFKCIRCPDYEPAGEKS